MSRHHSGALANSPKMLIPTRHQMPTSPAPPDASSSCDWDCRNLPGNGNAAMGTAVALHPLASVSANFLDGTSWCFQEGAALSQVSTLMGTSKQPSLGAWRTVQPWFDLVGYGASMRLSLVSPLVPLQHLISRT